MRNLNKFTKFVTFLPIILISQFAFSDQLSISDSVITVDKMLKRDNFYAKQSADAIDALFITPITTSSKKAITEVKIRKITAIDNKYNISLTVNGSEYNNATIGTKVDKCAIESILERCVVLIPIKKSTNKSFCPTSCWNGISDAPIVNSIQTFNVNNTLPLPTALPTLPFNKISYPAKQSLSAPLTNYSK